MDSAEFKRRTRAFALKIIKLVERLPRTRAADVIARQLVKSATSVGANYRAACRAKSNADFIAKMGIVEEEAYESSYWMELLVDSSLVKKDDVADLLNEANEFVAMSVASIKTARGNRR